MRRWAHAQAVVWPRAYDLGASMCLYCRSGVISGTAPGLAAIVGSRSQMADGHALRSMGLGDGPRQTGLRNSSGRERILTADWVPTAHPGFQLVANPVAACRASASSASMEAANPDRVARLWQVSRRRVQFGYYFRICVHPLPTLLPGRGLFMYTSLNVQRSGRY